MTKTTMPLGCCALIMFFCLLSPGAVAQEDWTPGAPHPDSPHVVAGNEPGTWRPEAGYRYINKDQNDLRVHWVPGIEHRDWPHVYSDGEEGKWRPAPGYSYFNDTPGDFRVEWKPGLKHREHENVVAAPEEGRWSPAPGYKYVNQEPGDFRVVWSPGKKHADHPGVIAADEVDEWTPAPGFNWVTQEEGDFRVNWTPGEAHPEHENVVAGAETNIWVPADGYEWVTTEPNDFRVRKATSTPETPAPATGGKDQRVALVIGNVTYEHSDPLKNCVNDAREMGDLLEELGFDVERAYDVSWAQMDEAVDRFIAKLNRGAVGWFYFSGHGMQLDGINYLLPVDFTAANATKARHRSLAADYVRESMEEKGARVIVLILDACRTNPYKAARAGSAGLASMSGGEGTLIAFATAPGKTASDNQSEGLGLFTRHLLDVMRMPGLGIEKIFFEARKRVYKASGGKQVPFLTTAVVEDFFLLPKR